MHKVTLSALQSGVAPSLRVLQSGVAPSLRAYALGAAAFILCGVAASAQSTQPSQPPLTIKLGGFLPAASGARTFGGSVQLSEGGELVIGGAGATTGVIYVDGQSGKDGGGHLYSYGAGLAARQTGASFWKGTVPYGGAGLGYYVSDIDTGFGNPANRQGGLGGKLFAGLGFGKNLIGELNYQFLPTAAGINPSGFGFQLGLRL